MKFRPIALVMLAASPAAAAQPVTGPYVDLGGGVDFLQNQIVTPYDDYGPTKRSYTFDPGAVAFAGAGYGFGNGFRLELNGDYADIHIRGVKTALPERAGGHEQQYGGFLDAIYDFNLNLPVTPYLGVGAGAQVLELDQINSGRYETVSSGLRQAETKAKFGYQGIAGVSLPIHVPGLSLTAEYRFIGMINPEPFVRGNGTNVDTIVRNGEVLTYRGTFQNIFNHELVLGLRYALFQPAPPPSTIVPALNLPQAQPACTYLVFFDWDRADLTARARQIVAEAAEASMRVQSTRIEVGGYTDLSGTAAYNQRLSIRRAQGVEAELVRDGVNRSEISVHGYGESNPLVPTAKGVREPQNRRVEIILR